ncbi:MAG: VWA domain-containing protein, partial [Roseiflexaceae bacterium]|nr:VWA domain-containing protein [Roseiflexaceae bacterium]
MRVSFIYPAALTLLVLLPLLWALAFALPRRLAASRFWSSLAVRSALLGVLVLSLAGAQVVRPVESLTTVFLLDASDSVSPSLRARAEAFIQAALQAMRPGDQAAVVIFGENALVERAPSPQLTLDQIASIPVVARTNIQDAIQLGLALFPADAQKRIVLLSDGGQNTGDALSAAYMAQTRAIPISYVTLSARIDDDVLVSELRAPTAARIGQQVELIAHVESSFAEPARLRLFSGENLLADQQAELVIGRNEFRFTVEAERQGFERFRVEIASARDGRAQNNQAEALIRVAGEPRVLLVEGEPGEARNFADALQAAGISAATIAPPAVPADLAGLSEYESIALINVPASALPIETLASLPAYVRDLGRGLLMVGGDRSYGLGGYGDTPLEQALPVYMDVRNREERPDLALVFVIDKSGSMDSCHCSGPSRQNSQISRGGTPKLDIAKQAVAEAAAMLQPRDTLGVVTFNNVASWAVQVGQGQSQEQITSALAPISPTGGTNVRAGLQAAEQALTEADARIKHAILLTDGWSSGGDNLDIAERMRENGITLSVVAAGSGSAEYLAQIATAGGGRYYPAATIEEVPQIFVQETITAAGNYLIEEPFTPAFAAPSPLLEGLQSGLPQLYGYNGTTPKDTAAVDLIGLDDAPILAHWQFGLGRSVAWTSDLQGKWAKDWVRWAGFPQFAAQLVGWTLPNANAGSFDTAFVNQGGQTVVNVQVPEQQRENLALSARIVSGDGATQELPFAQVGPGEYRAAISNPVQGTYLIQVVGQRDGRVIVQETSGLVVPYSPEYRPGQSDPALLAELARVSGGAQLGDPAAAFAPLAGAVTSAQEISLPLLLVALLLLPFDIALRRVVL